MRIKVVWGKPVTEAESMIETLIEGVCVPSEAPVIVRTVLRRSHFCSFIFLVSLLCRVFLRKWEKGLVCARKSKSLEGEMPNLSVNCFWSCRNRHHPYHQRPLFLFLFFFLFNFCCLFGINSVIISILFNFLIFYTWRSWSPPFLLDQKRNLFVLFFLFMLKLQSFIDHQKKVFYYKKIKANWRRCFFACILSLYFSVI